MNEALLKKKMMQSATPNNKSSNPLKIMSDPMSQLMDKDFDKAV